MAAPSTKIGFNTMSAQEICQAMRNKTHGGIAPELFSDFGSSVILSLASSENSDLHVEYTPPPHLSQLTGLAPVIQPNQRPGHVDYQATPDNVDTKHQSQLDNDNSEYDLNNDGWPLPSNGVNELEPFEDPVGFSAPPNLSFGPALVTYGKLMAVALPLVTYGKLMAVGASYGLNMTGFDHFFRSRWGFPADVDLSPAIPKVRCLDGFWLGVDRQPKPCVLAHPGLQKYFKVIRHPRQAFEGKMINWPRIDVIATIAAMSRILEHRPNPPPNSDRVDFIINARELPTRPTDPPLWLEKFPVLNEWKVRGSFLRDVEYLSHYKRNVN